MFLHAVELHTVASLGQRAVVDNMVIQPQRSDDGSAVSAARKIEKQLLIDALKHLEGNEIVFLDPARIRETIERYPDEILGLKVRLSRNIVGDLGSRPLARAIETGENLGLPVCVHTTDPPVSAVEIAKMLRPGDIYCHMYQGRGHTILDESGRVWPELFEAQRRGVVFEVGHGSMNFDARIAGESVKQGFWPDIISSDSTVNTFHKSETMWDLPHVLSKFLTMCMPLHRAIQAVISVPADRLGLRGLIGRLEKGYAAELTVCRITKREVSGAICASLQEETSLTPQMTIRGTEVIYPE